MTALHPLTKPALAALPPKHPGQLPQLKYIALSQLRVDDRYQRRIEPRGLKAIARICAEFDWNRFAPLICAALPGGDLYAIIDGQHRATAALLCGIDKVPCAVVNATAAEQPAIFAAVNGNVTPITIFQMFKAARAAKQEWALDIDRACAAAGLTPLLYPKAKKEIKPFETMAIGTLRHSIIRFGVDEVAQALKAAARQKGADDPGFWSSLTINMAVSEWRVSQGKRPEPEPPASSLAQRIRDLKEKGYSRFAIQAALRVKLSEIEAAISGAA